MAVIDELIIKENGESKIVDSADNKTIDVINGSLLNTIDYHFAKESEVVGGVCENAVEEPIIDLKVSGNSVQTNLPEEYTEYTSVTDTDGTVYTSSNGIYPAKRNSDGVFGLYNTNTNIFQTEV